MTSPTAASSRHAAAAPPAARRSATGARCRRATSCERLHDEFDLPYSASTELQMLIDDRAATTSRSDQCLHLAQGLEHAEVEVAPVHEGPHASRSRVGLRARDRARLEPRVALPGAAVADEVVLERRATAPSGPLSPKGRRRMSTRNQSVARSVASSKRMSSLAEAQKIFLVIDDAVRRTGLADSSTMRRRTKIRYTPANLPHAGPINGAT